MILTFPMPPLARGQVLQSDQNMMIPQMRNSYEFRLVQVSSYSGQAVCDIDRVWFRVTQKNFKIMESSNTVELNR